MDYKKIHFNDMDYIGYKVVVDLNNAQTVDFVSLWNALFKDTDKALMKENDAFIGFEAYQVYDIMHYYALAPSHAVKKCTKDHHTLRIPNGEYLLFKNTIETHGPAFFKRVYAFIDAQNIPIEKTFDIEYIPRAFDRNDKDSPIYVGVKLYKQGG